jgi:hypothetical protein
MKILKLAFFTIVGTFCAIMCAYALVDMFVILSTLIWVHK